MFFAIVKVCRAWSVGGKGNFYSYELAYMAPGVLSSLFGKRA
jgi:hypothetical protein